MKRPLLKLLFLLVLAPFVNGQPIDLPRISPKAGVSYTVGMTEIQMNYGAPAVKDREIWGQLVPYGKIWRGGANEATTLEISTDVNMEGQTLRAGKYSLFFIPGEREWTVILNNQHDQWGADAYDESKDEIRFTVEPRMNEGMQDRLTYTIHDMKLDMGYIKLAWERMRLYIRFKTDAMDLAMSNIREALVKSAPDRKWSVYAQGAQFLLDADGNIDQALDWATLSTELFSHSWNWFIRAKVEAKKGDMAAAVTSGTKCAETGLASEQDNFYENNRTEINNAIQTWASKMN